MGETGHTTPRLRSLFVSEPPGLGDTNGCHRVADGGHTWDENGNRQMSLGPVRIRRDNLILRQTSTLTFPGTIPIVL